MSSPIDAGGNDMLLTPEDMAHLPGAPFTQEEIDIAVATVQAAAGWHIALQREDTCILDVECWARTLRLPTRHLVEVHEVRDADTDDVIASNTYRVSSKFAHVRLKCGYWPHGYGRVAVDILHGFDHIPADLLRIIAEAVKSVRSSAAFKYTAGDFTAEQISGSMIAALDNNVSWDRYALWWQPGIA